MKRTVYVLTAAGLLAALAALGGCKSVSAHEARSNASPELTTTDASRGQSANEQARYIDHNTRTAWDDFKRLMLLDHPSRLSPYHVP